MDNMHARMRVPEREQAPHHAAPAALDEPSRYTSPRPAVVEPRKKQKRGLPVKWLGLLLAVIVVAALVLGAWKMFFSGTGADGIDHGKYQALFLSNGTITNNVYFGKLERISDGYYKLTDAFYIKAAQASGEEKTQIPMT